MEIFFVLGFKPSTSQGFLGERFDVHTDVGLFGGFSDTMDLHMFLLDLIGV